MLKAIFSPITLAFIGLTLVTLAASNASDNEDARTEAMLQELIEAQAPADAKQPENPSPKPSSDKDDVKDVKVS